MQQAASQSLSDGCHAQSMSIRQTDFGERPVEVRSGEGAPRNPECGSRAGVRTLFAHGALRCLLHATLCTNVNRRQVWKNLGSSSSEY